MDKLLALLEQGADLRRRFSKLNTGYLHPAEIDAENDLRTEKIKLLRARLSNGLRHNCKAGEKDKLPLSVAQTPHSVELHRQAYVPLSGSAFNSTAKSVFRVRF